MQTPIMFFLLDFVSKNDSFVSKRDLALPKKRNLFITVFTTDHLVQPACQLNLYS